MSTPLLSYFWDLASLKERVREKAVINLLTHLKESQSAIEDGTTCADLQYSIKRLVRGLSSSRDGARLGFSLALVTIIEQFSDIMNVNEYFDLVKSSNEATGSMKSQEEKDMYFGRLFGWMVFYRSGWISKLEGETRMSSMKHMFEDCINIYEKKSFIKEWTVKLLIDFLGMLNQPSEEVLFEEIVMKYFNDKKNAESLALKFAWMKYRNVGFEWKSIDGINEILRETTGNHPKVHIVWDYIIEQVYGSEMIEFWNTIIEKELFDSGNHVKKYLGFELFERIVTNDSNDSIIENLFTPCFVRSLTNNLMIKDSFLHKRADHLIQFISKIEKKEKLLPLVIQLLTHNFDVYLMKNRSLEEMVTKLEAKEYMSFVKSHYENNPGMAMDQLLMMLKRIKDYDIKEIIENFVSLYSMNPDQDKMNMLLLILISKADRIDVLKYLISRLEINSKCSSKFVQKLEKIFKKKKVDETFSLLFYFGWIQLYLNLAEGEPLVEELLECYKKSDLEATADVLIDLMTSFMVKASALWRKIGEIGFKSFCSQMSESGLHSLISVININIEEDVDQVGDEANDVEDESDEEMEESEESDDETPETSIDMSELNIQPRSEPVPFDELVDDEGMAEYDEKLVAIFTEKKLMKQEAVKLKREKIHFQCRVLDLIIIYIKKCPSSPLVLNFIEPLMKQYRKSTMRKKPQTVLSLKLKSTLQTLFQQKDYPKNTENEKIANDFIQQLLKTRNTLEYLGILNECLLYTMRLCSSKFIQENLQLILDDFAVAKNSHVSPTLLTCLYERFCDKENLIHLTTLLTEKHETMKAFIIKKLLHIFLIGIRRNKNDISALSQSVDQLLLFHLNGLASFDGKTIYKIQCKEYFKLMQPILKVLFECKYNDAKKLQDLLAGYSSLQEKSNAAFIKSYTLYIKNYISKI